MKKIWNYLKKSYSKNTLKQLKCYHDSIEEIPLYNWLKCTQGEIKYVRLNLAKGSDLNDVEAWQVLFDDYINKQGLNPTYLKILKAMKKKALLECDFVIENDRFTLTLLEVEIEKLTMLMNNNGVGMTIEQSLIHLSKWLGSWINTKNITASEYFDLVKEFERSNKMNNGKKN
jgi:hypothetical protein